MSWDFYFLGILATGIAAVAVVADGEAAVDMCMRLQMLRGRCH